MSEVEPRRLIIALAPGVMLAGVAGGMAFPILPSVGLRVGLPVAFIGLILAANRITRVVVSPLVGLCIDRFGGRRTLLVGLFIQVIVTTCFVVGVSSPHVGIWFLVGRILQGFGSSCAFVAAQALALHGRQSGRVAGAVRAAVQLGVPAGLVAGGVLSDVIGEAWTFAVGGLALVASFVVAFVSVPDLRVTVAKKSTLADSLRSFVDKRIASIGALGFASAFAGSGMLLTTTTIMVHTRHLEVFGLPERAMSSVLMGWLVVSEALSMSPLGRAGDRRDAHAKIALGGLLLTIPALVLLAFAESVWAIVLGLGLVGFSVACLTPSLLALVGKLVAPERRGLGVGGLQVATDIGGSLGPLAGTALFSGSFATPYLFAAGVSACLIPFALILVRADARTKAEAVS